MDAIVLTRFQEFHFEDRSEYIIDKERLLRHGDRMEKQTAADRAADAKYR